MALTQKQTADLLVAFKAQVEKSTEEVKTALADAIANGGQVTPELEAAVLGLGGSIQILDDLNADAATEIAPAE